MDIFRTTRNYSGCHLQSCDRAIHRQKLWLNKDCPWLYAKRFRVTNHSCYGPEASQSNMTTFHSSYGVLLGGNHLEDQLMHHKYNKGEQFARINYNYTPPTDDIETQITTLERPENILPDHSFHHSHHKSMIHILF